MLAGSPAIREALSGRSHSQPDRIIIHMPEACKGCGTHLAHSQPLTLILRQVFNICDGRLEVIEHRVEPRRCPACATTTKAKFPLGVRTPVQYG